MPEAGWAQRLVDRHRSLLLRPGRSDLSAGPRVGEGWRPLVETLLDRIAEALRQRASGSLRIVEIAEKYGGIRIDFAARNLPEIVLNAVQEAIDLAEARAECTCDVCGAVGGLRDLDGWFATRCDAHADGRPLEPPARDAGLVFRWNHRDGSGTASCRRYDRATDAFVDVTLPPPDIQED